MAAHRLIVDMTFVEEAHLEATIGTHILESGAEVEVVATGTQIGDVVTMSLEGEITDILAVMIKEWEDEGLAAEAFAEAVVAGGLEEM